MEDLPQFKNVGDLFRSEQLEQLEREAHPRHHWQDVREARAGRHARLTAGVGRWTYDSQLLTVTHRDPTYDIDLETLTTPAKLLDTLLQVTKKTWLRPEGLEELVTLLEAISDAIFAYAVVEGPGTRRSRSSNRSRVA